MRDFGKPRQLLIAHDIDPQLQLEVRHDTEQVRIATHVSIAVRRALHMSRPRLDGGQATGHGDIRAIVRVYAHLARHFLDGGAYDLRNAGGHGAAVRIAKDNAVRAGRGGGLQTLNRVISIRLETVEEVLGVEKDLPAGILQMANRIADHREIFLERRLEDVGDVPVVCFGDDRDNRSVGFEQCLQVRVGVGASAGLASRTEGNEAGALQVHLRDAGKELDVLGV